MSGDYDAKLNARVEEIYRRQKNQIRFDKILLFINYLLIALFITGLLYISKLITNVIYWRYIIKVDYTLWPILLLFFLFAYYIISQISLDDLVIKKSAHRNILPYISFLLIALFSLIWTLHILYEDSYAKKYYSNTIEFNTKKLCKYHLYSEYIDILNMSSLNSEKTFEKLFNSKLNDIQNGKVEIKLKIDNSNFGNDDYHRFIIIEIKQGIISYRKI
jgi:hypothetical protein